MVCCIGPLSEKVARVEANVYKKIMHLADLAAIKNDLIQKKNQLKELKEKVKNSKKGDVTDNKAHRVDLRRQFRELETQVNGILWEIKNKHKELMSELRRETDRVKELKKKVAELSSCNPRINPLVGTKLSSAN